MENNKILKVTIYFVNGDHEMIVFDEKPYDDCFFQTGNMYKYFIGKKIITYNLQNILYTEIECEKDVEPIKKKEPVIKTPKITPVK